MPDRESRAGAATPTRLRAPYQRGEGTNAETTADGPRSEGLDRGHTPTDDRGWALMDTILMLASVLVTAIVLARWWKQVIAICVVCGIAAIVVAVFVVLSEMQSMAGDL